MAEITISTAQREENTRLRRGGGGGASIEEYLCVWLALIH